MFALCVRQHVMIAHSLKGEVFGPAQRLHGATFVVEAEFRRRELDGDGLVVDIVKASGLLAEVLAPINYRNLDDVPEFAGKNTTTEFLARHIFEALRSRIGGGVLGPANGGLVSLKVTLRETPDAWASYEGMLT
jgi:6-pyruvoyltetrahydropterin/6-carboxytetrahydropterin synthase